MQAQVFFPSLDLQPYVYAYIIIKVNVGDSVETSYIIPHGCPQLIIFCENPSKYFLNLFDQPALYQSFIGGQINHPIFFEYSKYSEAVIVMFKPVGFFHLSQIPQSEFTNQICDLNFVLKQKKFLVEQIITSANDIDKIFKTESLLRTFIKSDGEYTTIDKAIEIIVRNKGNCHFKKDIIEKYNIAPRTFERRFQKLVGLNPKEYAKIVRFNNIFNLIKAKPNLDWQDITILCGYFDQAHLIRDFKRFTEISPSSFYSKKLEIGRLLLGYTAN